MKFYDEKKVILARNLRKKGNSILYISQSLKIPNTTISRWVRDIKNNNIQFNNNLKKNIRYKQTYKNILFNKKITSNLCKIYCSLIYWCEGSKYPSSNFVAFANSDPVLVQTFINLLRQGFKINEKKIKIILQLHSTQNITKFTAYWSKLLKIPKEQFYKPTITNPTRSMKRKNYHGTCTIKYHDVKLLLQIVGIYEKFGQNMERWLSGR